MGVGLLFNISLILNIKSMKIKRKVSKEMKSLLIAMLLGDGTISNNYVFKLCHSSDQEEYLL
jgi:hypothetical protein